MFIIINIVLIIIVYIYNYRIEKNFLKYIIAIRLFYTITAFTIMNFSLYYINLYLLKLITNNISQ